MESEKEFYEEIENTREGFCHIALGSSSRSDGWISWIRRIMKYDEVEVNKK